MTRAWRCLAALIVGTSTACAEKQPGVVCDNRFTVWRPTPIAPPPEYSVLLESRSGLARFLVDTRTESVKVVEGEPYRVFQYALHSDRYEGAETVRVVLWCTDKTATVTMYADALVLSASYDGTSDFIELEQVAP